MIVQEAADAADKGAVTGQRTSSRWQRGRVRADDHVHAVRPTITGYRAWCGAGNIDGFDLDPFDDLDPLACPRCADVLRVVLPEQRQP